MRRIVLIFRFLILATKKINMVFFNYKRYPMDFYIKQETIYGADQYFLLKVYYIGYSY